MFASGTRARGRRDRHRSATRARRGPARTRRARKRGRRDDGGSGVRIHSFIHSFAMESFKTSFDVRSSDGRVLGEVGVSNETRCERFVRDIARAVSANEEGMRRMNLSRRELAAAPRGVVRVTLAWRGTEGKKSMPIDESTSFAQLLARHHPKSSDSRAHFVVTRRLPKRERKRAAREGTKRRDDGGNEEDASASEGVKGKHAHSAHVPHIPRPMSTSVSTPTASADASRRATTSAPSFGPLSSQQSRRSSRKEQHHRDSKDASSKDSKEGKDKSTPPSSASSQSDAAKFLSTKIRDPVVFPAFRRSVHGAIGDPFPTPSQHDVQSTARTVTSPSRGGARSSRGSRAKAP